MTRRPPGTEGGSEGDNTFFLWSVCRWMGASDVLAGLSVSWLLIRSRSGRFGFYRGMAREEARREGGIVANNLGGLVRKVSTRNKCGYSEGVRASGSSPETPVNLRTKPGRVEDNMSEWLSTLLWCITAGCMYGTGYFSGRSKELHENRKWCTKFHGKAAF